MDGVGTVLEPTRPKATGCRLLPRASDGTGNVISSRTYAVSLSTLTLASLIPQTTYYFRVGGLNWNNVPNFSAFLSTPTANVPVPAGFHGNVQGVSSITWTWGDVGADSYVLYMATSPSTIVFSPIASTFYTETNLSTNTAYGRVVAAVDGGVQGALSNSATTYTAAAVPGQPSFSNVSYSSFTVTWSTNTNPGYTRLRSQLFDG